MPAATCSCSPETRTCTNSSRLDEKIARNFARSSSGRSASSASASTRALKSSQDSSRFRSRCGPGASRVSASPQAHRTGRSAPRPGARPRADRSARRSARGRRIARAGLEGGARISGRMSGTHLVRRPDCLRPYASAGGDPIADARTRGDIEVNDGQRGPDAEARTSEAVGAYPRFRDGDPRPAHVLAEPVRTAGRRSGGEHGRRRLPDVSLAGSIFFTQPLGQSRTQVLLYLLLTIAPFAVVGPIIGPALDRSKAGRRTLMAIGCFGRARGLLPDGRQPRLAVPVPAGVRRAGPVQGPRGREVRARPGGGEGRARARRGELAPLARQRRGQRRRWAAGGGGGLRCSAPRVSLVVATGVFVLAGSAVHEDPGRGPARTGRDRGGAPGARGAEHRLRRAPRWR